MKRTALFQQAKKIADTFTSIIKEDESLDRTYVDNKNKIEVNYKTKIAELEAKRQQRKTTAGSTNQASQTNIQNGLNALDTAEKRVPVKYRKKYKPSSVQPQEPDFQALDELAKKINDGSFSGAIKRLTGTGGYSSMMDMVTDYLDHIAAGRLYLNNEKKKSTNYLSQEIAAADSEFSQEKAKADQRKREIIAQNDQLHSQAETVLQDKLIKSIESPELVQFDSKLVNALEQLAAFDDCWNSYTPTITFPDELMLGAISIPLSIPSPADQMIQQKMQNAFSSGKGFCVPMTVDMSSPLKLLINYDERCKSEVMDGIQSIILKWIKFMPPYSFSITYIDPNDRGSNLGQLQKLEEITAFDVCKKVYASREDINRRLKELEEFVDTTCSKLAGIGSAYDYNLSNEPLIVQHLVVINDYPGKFDRAAEEALDVLINNAAKCGISIIFTKNGSLSDLPYTVQHSFLRINASINGHTIPVDGKTYDFQFDGVCSNCESFIDSVKAIYNEGFKVDNRFANFFSNTTFNGYRESTRSLLIPFAVDSRKRLVELELGGALSAHALLSGTTGSGKSTTLHMLITSIILNYHPDDVELWLVDYNKVEFAQYMSNMPPHVKLIGLERSTEFTFSLLKKVNDECQRRMELFKQVGVSDITKYKIKFGVRSLPRIILIIDEFHQLTQAIQNEQEYVIILENMLSEYRKYGLSCLFSDQAISVGLRGLTEKGKKQMRTRIAMANDIPEIKDTLALDNSLYDEKLIKKMNKMDEGDVIFKRVIKDATDETQIIIDKYRTVYVTKDEIIKSIEYVKSLLGGTYSKSDVLIIDGQGRKYCDEDAIVKYETVNGEPTSTSIPIYIGTPANLNPCFCFTLQDRLDSNVMLIGSDTEMRASVVLYTISCFSRLSDYEVVIFADKRDELYRQYRKELESLSNTNIHIKTEIKEVCSYVDGLLEAAKDGKKPKILMVWLGIESIGADLSMFPQKTNIHMDNKSTDFSKVDSLTSDIDALLAGFDEPADNKTKGYSETETTSINTEYDARDDISNLISNGSRFGIHSLVTYSSVKMLRQSRFVKLECFEHKIAFAMSRDDWSNYLDRVHYISDLDKDSAVYYDGGSATHIFRPYLFQ